jgi:phosphatidate cytidylyltransferase
MTELKQRLLTALIAVPLLFYALALGPIHLLYALLLGAFFMVSLEWGLMTQKGYAKAAYMIVSFALWFVLMFLLSVYQVAWFAVGFSAFAFCLLCFYQSGLLKRMSSMFCFFMGLGFLIPAFVAMIWLIQHDRVFLAWSFCAVFLADSAAYAVGGVWGHWPLASRISPNKTITGLIGAVVSVWLFIWSSFAFGFLPKTVSHFSVLYLLALPLLVVVGDLFESMVKRSFQVKDSGHLLPGHGGFLDRLDGLCYALPFLYLWYDLFVK